jgi:hypothetical protein
MSDEPASGVGALMRYVSRLEPQPATTERWNNIQLQRKLSRRLKMLLTTTPAPELHTASWNFRMAFRVVG